jgi:hypothetical protein
MQVSPHHNYDDHKDDHYQSMHNIDYHNEENS